MMRWWEEATTTKRRNSVTKKCSGFGLLGLFLFFSILKVKVIRCIDYKYGIIWINHGRIQGATKRKENRKQIIEKNRKEKDERANKSILVSLSRGFGSLTLLLLLFLLLWCFLRVKNETPRNRIEEKLLLNNIE